MAATDLERLIVQVEANSTQLTRELAKLTGGVDTAMNRVERRTAAMSQRVTAGFGRAGIAISSFFSARAIVGFISRVTEAADKLQALADRTGVGTDQLQRLAGAAAKANVDTEQLNDALDIFARNIGRASDGTGDLAKVMKDFGITAGNDLVGTLLDVADAVQKAKTTSEEYRITQAAFGRSSAELVGFLRQGRDAIREQAEAFNSGISPDAVKRLAEFNQHWKEISVSFSNMAAGPAADVLGGLSQFLKDLEQGTWPQRIQALISLLSFGAVAPPDTAPFTQALAQIESLSKQIDQKQLALRSLQAEGVTGPVITDLQTELDALIVKYQTAFDLATKLKGASTSATAPTAAKPFGGPTDGAAPKTLTELLGDPTEGLKRLQDTLDAALQTEKDFVSEQYLLGREARERVAIDTRAFQEQELAENKAHHEEMQAVIDAADIRAAEKRQEDADNAEEEARGLQAERIQAVQDYFGEVATLSRSGNATLAAIGKAAAIAQATIDGILAVQKTLATIPPPLNIPAAAVMAGVQAANVARIAAMEKGGRVQAGQPYIVGEKRPELFIPDTAGRIIPRIPPGLSATSSQAFSFNIDARGAQAGVADQIEAAMDRFADRVVARSLGAVNRRLPDMMNRANFRKR